MIIRRVIPLALLIIASAWIAILNGQPLFHPDSSSYVRGPDFAIVYFLGNNFATSWTQNRTLEGNESSAISEGTSPLAQATRLNSPFDKSVLSGRSIYYGALLYFGHLTSNLWLSVFLQAAIFVYLSYTLTVTCLRFSFFSFVTIDLIILFLTPISFYISFLTPDIFASFVIIATAIIVAFWKSLAVRDQAITASVLLYSTLVHTSHLALLFGLACVLIFASITMKRSTILTHRFLPVPVFILVVLIFLGSLGEIAFSYAIRHTVGTYPIRPPFIMARLIADGPGYKFLKTNCATKSYVVCRYIDRLPEPSAEFLWSRDPKMGVFSVVDAATRQALSSEQWPFVLDIVRHEPISIIVDEAKNVSDQFMNVGIKQFFINDAQLNNFREKLPAAYFTNLLRTHIVLNQSVEDWIGTPIQLFYFSVYLISMSLLTLIWLFWASIQFRTKLDTYQNRQFFVILTGTLAGLFLNAAICGALSESLPRYQTRISWVPLYLFLLFVGNYWSAFNLVERLGGSAKNSPDEVQ